ncbi:MAG: diaminopimelate decarboxylase, partial [Planctomycetota bacterium]
MDFFEYREGNLYCEDVPVEKLAAEHGTPLYVYSKATLLDHFNKIRKAFAEADPVICFAVKANGNLSVLRTLAEAGSGFDLVSGGELYRVLRAGGVAAKTVFAGVG